MSITEKNNDFAQPDIRDRVMSEIKTKKIKMNKPLFFLAQRIGLQSILALIVFFGAFSVSVILFCLKKAGVLDFLAFGFPKVESLLSIFPYDYAALVIFSVALANYILKKIYFSACLVSWKILSAVLFALVAAMGLLLFILGVGSAVKL